MSNNKEKTRIGVKVASFIGGTCSSTLVGSLLGPAIRSIPNPFFKIIGYIGAIGIQGVVGTFVENDLNAKLTGLAVGFEGLSEGIKRAEESKE